MLREVGGTITVLRVGIDVETLSAVWGRGNDDMWVGGARGTAGTLLHWNGSTWQELPPWGSPIDALNGLSNGDLVVVANGLAFLQTVEGRGVASLCDERGGATGVGAIRDSWVQAGRIWLAGDGIARFDPVTNTCTRLDDRTTFGLWGDGSSRLVAFSVGADANRLELREWAPTGFVTLGAPFGSAQYDVRGGKRVAGDSSGRLHAILHTELGSREGLAAYDPSTGLTTVSELNVNATRPLAGETVFGLTTSQGQVTFAGARGLRGRFDAVTPRPSSFRRGLRQGMAAPDGTVFANCSHSWELDTTICRWNATTGWSELPRVADFGASSGIATSASGVLLSGQKTPTSSPELRLWNGASWSTDTPRTTVPLRPLFTTGPNDLWAWSDYDTVHFDGASWSTVAKGEPETGGNQVAVGRAADDIWFLDGVQGLSHWDGRKLTSKARLPAGFTARTTGRGMAAVDDGVWIAGTEADGAERLLHYNGKDWVVVPLPGVRVGALARGPDGNVRMLSEFPSPLPAVYLVSDTGTTKELSIPGVALRDLLATGSDLLAIGVSGATLRLAKVSSDGIGK